MSEASRRYERSVDPAISRAALDRCAALLAEIAGGTVEPTLTDWRAEHTAPDWSQPPVAIAVPEEDGKPAWARWGKLAIADLQTAIDNDYGKAWLEDWMEANMKNMADLSDFNRAWGAKIGKAYNTALDHFVIQAEQARDEARQEFPTIPVEWLGNPEDGGTQDWIAFERNVLGYIRRMPNAAVAGQWWIAQAMSVKTLSEAGPINDKGYTGAAAAKGIHDALFGRFPQLRK